ncbi:MAG TPA: TetR/AcrR family transcriptional regulator [Capillimicrobium sp.]|jgi:AcrR family transcriptional regulator
MATQAQRSAATREALLDATLASLVDVGYAGTTTAGVCERAGLSRGAHLHHFQTRAALMAAAVEHLADQLGQELLVALESLPEGEGRSEAGLDLLWRAYAGELFQAALDLWTHARTDPELRERLEPVERMLERRTARLARFLFPALADRPDVEPLVVMAVATVRGLALLDTFQPGAGRNARHWPACRGMLVALFEGTAQARGPYGVAATR